MALKPALRRWAGTAAIGAVVGGLVAGMLAGSGDRSAALDLGSGAAWFGTATAIGFREAQRTTNGKAWGAMLLPFAATCLCCCAAAWLMMSGLSSLKVHGG